ncbi:MAG: hypothetical protein AAF483_02005 [Planctomycetota bacterium]
MQNPHMQRRLAGMLQLLTMVVVLVLSCQHAWSQGSLPARQSTSEATYRERMDFRLANVQFDDRSVREIIDLLSSSTGLNIVATQEAAEKKVTMTLRDVSVIDAIEVMAKIGGLWYRVEEQTGIIRLMTAEQYQDDLVVFRNDLTRVFTLLHPNAISIAQTIQSLYGPRVILGLQPFDDDILVGTTGIIGGGGGFGGVGGQFGGGLGGGLGGGFGGGLGGGFGGGLGGLGGGFGGGLGGLGGGFGGGLGGGFGGGLGGFGGGLGGLGGGFGGGLGGGGFGGGAFGRGGGGQNGLLFGSPLFNVQQLPGDPLTSGQLAQLQQRIQTLEGGQQGVASQDVQDVTSREPLIYVAHNKTHSLVIVRTSDEEAMKAIERLILDLDRPTPEVLLEMKILEVRLTDNFRSILDVAYNVGPQGPPAGAQVQRNPFLNSAQTAAQSVLGIVDSPELNGNGSFIYQFLNDQIRARLEVLQENNFVASVASPVLLSSNNRPARIFVGEERVLVTGINSGVVTSATGPTTSVVQPQTEVRDIGTTLVVLPKINADRSVTLSIAQDQSEVVEDSQQLPVSNGTQVQEFPIDSVRSSNLQGTVVAHDGLTIAVGGLITDTTNVRERRVPGLSRLPLVGKLFRQYIDENVKTELILLITPHVITTPMEGQFKSEARLRALSDHPAIISGEAANSLITEELPMPSPNAPSHGWDATKQAPWRGTPEPLPPQPQISLP